MAVLIFKQGNFTETGSLAYAEPIFFTDANTLIISGGVSTYANTEVSPQITAGRVDYRVATMDSINTGSFIVTSDVSASNLLLDGNATIRGNITMGGSGLDFGDASDDNVVFKADISSSILPNNDDSFDLGSDSQRWKTGYLSNLNLSGSLFLDGGPIDLHSDTYISASSGTFTHLAVGSYLDIDVTGNTTFDGQGTLSVSSSGALKVDSPTSIGIGTNSDAPIDIDSTTLDIDASGALTIDSATSISIGTTADKPIDIDSTTLDIDSSGAITINGESTTAISSSGALSIDSETGINIGTTTDKPIDIDASTFDVDASGALTIDSNTSIGIGTNADKPIDIDSTTLDIDASGAITINGESTTAISSSGALSIDSETGINIGTTTDKPIDIDSSTLDIDASGAITIDGTSTLSIDAGGVDIDASNSGKVTIDGAGGIDIGVAADVAIDIDSSTLDIDASGALTIDSATSIGIGTNADKPVNIDSTTFDVDSTDGIRLKSNNGISLEESGVTVVSVDANQDVSFPQEGGSKTDPDVDIVGYLKLGEHGGFIQGALSSSGEISSSADITTSGLNAGNINVGITGDNEIDTDSGNLTIDSAGGTVTIDDNTIITGDLTVNGTRTFTNTATLDVADNIININYGGSSVLAGLYANDVTGGNVLSGSILWNGTTDRWIAGQSGSEQTLLLNNGDSIVSGSGTNNQITTFTGTHGVDSSANLTFDGSTLRVTGTEEITGNLSGSSSGSFKNINVAESQIVGNDLYVGGTIFHKDDTDTKITLTDDDINITVGNTNMIDFTQDTVSEITINEQAQDLDVRIEGEADNKLFFTDASVSKIGIGTNSPGEKLTIHGNVSGSASGSFLNVHASEFLTSTQATIGNVLISGSIIQAPGGSPLVVSDTLNLDSNNIIGVQSITATATGSIGRVIGSIGATNGVISGSSQVNADSITNFDTNVKAKLDADTVISGSSQIRGLGFVTGSETAVHPNWLTSDFVAGNNITITSGSNTLKIEASGGGGAGTISGSSQIDHDATTNFVAGEHFLQSAITTVGTVTTGNVTAILPTGVLSGSLLPGSNVTINSSSDGFFISSSASGGGANDATITLTAGSGLDGGGAFTVNQAGNETITFTVGDGVISGSSQVSDIGNSQLTNSAITISGTSVSLGGAITDETLFGGTGVVSGSAGVSKTLQEVTTAGASSTNALTVGNGTDSTSKTTGGLIVSGGLGVLNTINAGGDVVAYASSDERLKDNIKPIENPLEVISQISGNTFDWNSEKQNIYNGKDYGVIAQEIQKVMPELVDTRDSGYLAVKYDKIVPLLIESIKELKREIEELKSK